MNTGIAGIQNLKGSTIICKQMQIADSTTECIKGHSSSQTKLFPYPVMFFTYQETILLRDCVLFSPSRWQRAKNSTHNALFLSIRSIVALCIDICGGFAHCLIGKSRFFPIFLCLLRSLLLLFIFFSFFSIVLMSMCQIQGSFLGHCFGKILHYLSLSSVKSRTAGIHYVM